MAGDIGVQEAIVVGLAPATEAAAATLARVAAPAGRPGPRALHRYGRLVIVGQADAAPEDGSSVSEGAAESIAAVAASTLDIAELSELSPVEQLGLEAFRRRESADYAAAKAARPRQGEPWDMEGCLQRGGPVDDQGHPLPLGAAGGAGAPTSAYMEGTIAVGIVMVEGPTAALQFSAAERQHVVAEVQNGLGWHAAQNPAANITFVYDIHTVPVTVQPNPNAPDLEGLWRNPAMAALGYAANWSGVTSYVEHLRTSLATQWTYCAYFTKYPLSWFAYASIGGPRLVMAYDNDGWGPDNIDRVFAHETGHIFGCPDEYAASGCTCGGSWGRFGTPNSNCQNCAPGGGVSCIMKQNDYTYCSATPSHLGWSMGTTTGNPVLIQSRFGTQGNYELAVPSAFTGIDARVRNNDLPGMPWSAVSQFAQTLGRVDSVSMIQSSFGTPGNLELVARVGDTLHAFWRDSGPTFTWNGPAQIATGAAGNPVLIQSRFGQTGNFELAYPLAAGGIGIKWRDNDAPAMPWSATTSFAQSLGRVDALTMIQSSFGTPGNLELVARVGDTLHAFWRDSGPTFTWNGPVQIATGAAGNPVLIQSRFGQTGNFELAYPLVAGGIGIKWRDNDAPGLPWSATTSFGQTLGPVDSMSMIQSNFGTPGNLEVIARVGSALHAFWRDSGPTYSWNGPYQIL